MLIFRLPSLLRNAWRRTDNVVEEGRKDGDDGGEDHVDGPPYQDVVAHVPDLVPAGRHVEAGLQDGAVGEQGLQLALHSHEEWLRPHLIAADQVDHDGQVGDDDQPVWLIKPET